MIKPSLRGKCPYSEFFQSAFFRIRTEYGDIRSISLYSVQMSENTDQKISEYGHFLRCACKCYYSILHFGLSKCQKKKEKSKHSKLSIEFHSAPKHNFSKLFIHARILFQITILYQANDGCKLFIPTKYVQRAQEVIIRCFLSYFVSQCNLFISTEIYENNTCLYVLLL